MARAKKTPFQSWESCKADGIEQRYIRLGNSQLLHQTMLSLSHSAFRIYVYMRLESGGKRDFEYPYSKYKEIISKQGFQNVIKELVEKGFLEVKEHNANLRKANVYRFSEDWKEK